MPSFIVVEYVWQILGRGAFLPLPSPIREQPRKNPSWIGLIITRLGSLFGNQWQSSILEETISISSFLKIFNAVSSKSFRSVLSGIPLISRHSCLEYWEFFQHCRSKEAIFSFSLLLTYLTTLSSDSSLMQFCFRSERSCLESDRSVFILVKVAWNLFDNLTTITSSFESFLNAASKSDVFCKE